MDREETILSKVPMIAIVDDDESFRRATASFVRSLGYVAAAFGSAEAFLTSDRIRDTDCLISDVQMPVIFVTAFPEVKTKGRALAAGAVGYLDKPFSDQTLIACLNEALSDRPS